MRIYVRVCVCVCVCTCMYARKLACIHTHVYLCLCLSVCLCMCVYVSVRMCIPPPRLLIISCMIQAPYSTACNKLYVLILVCALVPSLGSSLGMRLVCFMLIC